jgi:hypothetical protein
MEVEVEGLGECRQLATEGRKAFASRSQNARPIRSARAKGLTSVLRWLSWLASSRSTASAQRHRPEPMKTLAGRVKRQAE